MKVKTIQGEVELTADRVRPGMVFRADAGFLFTVNEQPPWEGMWRGVDGRYAALMLWKDDSFLGCDPAIAERWYCEVYGVAPHCDAAAHGFARRRDGGAVDLRSRCPGGTVFRCAGDDGLVVVNVDAYGIQFGAGGAEFIGLDRWRALPEDVRQLCCGATWGMAQCTLVMGHGGDHVEIVDMRAQKWRDDKVGAHEPRRRINAGRCPLCYAPPGAAGCNVCDKGFKQSRAAMVGTESVKAAALLSEADERRAAEAQLVALVNAVPEGLDPIGWRAAALAVSERSRRATSYEWPRAAADRDHFAAWLADALARGLDSEEQATPYADGYEAYRRAVAPPGPRPKVERRIGGKAVRIVVDHGEE